MRRVIAALFLAAVLIVPRVSAQPEPLAGFDALITKAMKDWRIPGLAIAVVKDGQIVFAHGYGVRELGKPRPRRHAHAVRHRLDDQGDDRGARRHARRRQESRVGRAGHHLPAVVPAQGSRR